MVQEVLMNVALEGDRKSSGYCHWREAWQKCVCRAIASKQEPERRWRRLRLAAVKIRRHGNLGNTKLTTELTITVVKRAAELAQRA